MPEYVIFIHGVNTRDEREQPSYADQLIRNIQNQRSSDVDIRPIPLYWGDVNVEAEQALLEDFKESPVWDKLAFQNFRAHQIIQFIGDAALYISRAVGQLAVERLIQQTIHGLQEFESATDHIHLVSHSMGTVILFDILFSSRWDVSNTNGYEGVEQLRNMIFCGGSPVRSIHTMGSPIGIFSLTMLRNTPVPNTHDVTARLEQYLKALCSTIAGKFPWRNYLHPMDIIASPIEHLTPKILNALGTCLDIKDILTQDRSLLDNTSILLLNTIGQNALGDFGEVLRLALLAGKAHSSYWSSPVVSSTIVQMIEMVAR